MARHSFVPDVANRKLVWEVLISAYCSRNKASAASAAVFGYFGGIPVISAFENIAVSNPEGFEGISEILLAAIVLLRLPHGARVHVVTDSRVLASALSDPIGGKLPEWLRQSLLFINKTRHIVVEEESERTPRMQALTKNAKTALSYARPLHELKLRLVGSF